MRSRIPLLFTSLVFGAALTFMLNGCATSDEQPDAPAEPPRQTAAAAEEKTPETKTATAPEKKTPETKAPEPKTAAPKPGEAATDEELVAAGLAARAWWVAVLSEDRKTADLYVMNPDTNEFLTQYVREQKKNAASDAEARKEIEGMRKALFGKATTQDGFIIVPLSKDGELFLKIFFTKRNGKWRIFTVN